MGRTLLDSHLLVVCPRQESAMKRAFLPAKGTTMLLRMFQPISSCSVASPESMCPKSQRLLTLLFRQFNALKQNAADPWLNTTTLALS